MASHHHRRRALPVPTSRSKTSSAKPAPPPPRTDTTGDPAAATGPCPSLFQEISGLITPAAGTASDPSFQSRVNRQSWRSGNEAPSQCTEEVPGLPFEERLGSLGVVYTPRIVNMVLKRCFKKTHLGLRSDRKEEAVSLFDDMERYGCSRIRERLQRWLTKTSPRTGMRRLTVDISNGEERVSQGSGLEASLF
ncbi:hypothetical protein TRIUR3_13572 [Triticum urartu]|uniref:Uncharacterized protein n=1 Tax=Triticum urartu TaxID=4572 RepID=M7ZQW2_TRIUA|nr:hypothetical protein TRIUR3_13572 [Triticum urartu]